MKREIFFYIINWTDAAYSYREDFPGFPTENTVLGCIVEENSSFVKIATNFKIKSDNIYTVDGLLIPKTMIKSMRKLNF